MSALGGAAGAVGGDSLVNQIMGQILTYKNAAIGYSAVDGTDALGTATGTVCLGDGTGCQTITDAASSLDSGQSFDTLWSNATVGSGNSTDVIPVVQVNGKWYVQTSLGQS